MASQLKLPDGRNMDYLVTGAKDGFPLIFVHGTPGSYLELPKLPEACEKRGLKLVTLSRSGYGSSTRHKGRSVVDVVADLEALKKHLGIGKCLAAGWSGGGPAALACAARLSGCVGVLCVAGVAPWNAEGLDWLAGQGEDNIKETEAALQGEQASYDLLNAQRPEMLAADAAGLTEAMASLLPDVDKRALLDNHELGQNTVDTFREALKLGVDGWLDDNLAFVKHWGFELDEIKVPVFLYQGDVDLMVPFAHGQWLAKHLPSEQVREHFMEGQGHISIFLGQLDNMLDELLAITKA